MEGTAEAVTGVEATAHAFLVYFARKAGRMKNGALSRHISKKVIYKRNAENSSRAHRRGTTFRQ